MKSSKSQHRWFTAPKAPEKLCLLESEDCNLGATSAGTKCVFAPQAATNLRFGAASAEHLMFSNITPSL